MSDAPSQLELFGRIVNLTLAKQPTGFVGSNPKYFDQLGNGLEITDLKVKFEIKKSLGKEPNTCTMTVTNLSPESRAFSEAKPLLGFLSAGHDGVARRLFAGNITFSRSRRDKTDWETKMQIGDGTRAFSHAFMSRSYAKPVSAQQVLSDAAASMGLTLPPEAEQSQDLRQALATGLNAHGPARDILTKLLAPYGFGWSIQNGRLQILADDQVSSTNALLINQQTGLIGTPEHSVPKRPGDPIDLTFETLIYPEIQPGCMVKVESEAAEGVYKVQDVEHRGDIRGTEWTTKVKALPLGQSKKKGHKKK